jgi:hypothetical protein
MTQNVLLQKSPSDQSKEKDKVSLQTLLKDVKKADLVKNIASEAASGKGVSKERLAVSAFKLLKGAGIQLDNINDSSTPMQVLNYLRNHYDLNTNPSIEYIDHKERFTGNLKNMVQAVLTVIETDLPTQDYFVFEKVGEAFNWRKPRFDHMLPLSVGECAWTVYCMNKLRPQELSSEVGLYIAACANEYGLIIMPDSLSKYQTYLEQFSGISETQQLLDLYRTKTTSSGNEMMDRQLDKLYAVDAYMKQEDNK